MVFTEDQVSAPYTHPPYEQNINSQSQKGMITGR